MNKLLLSLAIGIALTAGQIAHAEPILDFGVVTPTPSPPAKISFAGGATPLVGTGIQVDNVVGLDTPLHDQVLTLLTSGVLSFTTGNFTGASGGIWNFGSGGNITIMGDDGFGPPGVTALMTGSFLSATVISVGGTAKIAGSAFLNIVDPDLAAYYGLAGGATVPFAGAFNIQFRANATPPGAFTSTIVLSGDITTSPAPEPGTLALAGVALVGGTLWGRRRTRQVVIA
ncbi:PEP-CTERM sorting domain-containing protein [Singulisphaera rosea]